MTSTKDILRRRLEAVLDKSDMRVERGMSNAPAEDVAIMEEMVGHGRSWERVRDTALAVWPKVQIDLTAIAGRAVFLLDGDPLGRLIHVDLGRTYRLTENSSGITCLLCGLTSYNANDVEKLFCGNCHLWHGKGRREA